MGEIVDKGHSRDLFENPAESRPAQMGKPGPLLDGDHFRIVVEMNSKTGFNLSAVACCRTMTNRSDSETQKCLARA